MNRFAGTLGAALLLLALGALSAEGRTAAVSDLGPRLHRAVERGEIDPSLASVYWLYAVLAPERLPPAYRIEVSQPGRATRGEVRGEPPMLRCGMAAVRRTSALLEDLSPELRAEVEGLLAPHRPQSRSGAAGRALAKESATHVAPNWIETANFSIEWDPVTLTNEDGSTPPRDDDGDGIPDTVELWASYFEASFAEMTSILSPNDPGLVFAGTGVETFRIIVEIDALVPGLYGLTFALPDFIDEIGPVIVVNTDLSFVPLNDEGREAGGDPLANIQGAMKVTAAHELFHVVHFLYDSLSGVEDDWWWEASSVWMEDEIFDGVNDYYQYFGEGADGREPLGEDLDPAGWAQFVEFGLLADIFSSPTSQIYGGGVFPKYLSQHVTGQASVGQVWFRIRGGFSVLQALDDFARDAGFTAAIGLPGLDGLYAGYAAANAALASEYEEGANFGEVPIRGDTLDTDTEEENLPSRLGSTYRQGAGEGAGGPLRVSLGGDPDVAWGLSVLLKRTEPERVLALGVLDPLGSPSVSVASFGVGEIVIEAVSFLSETGAAVSYTTTVDGGPVPDSDPPTEISGLRVTAVPGGLDLSWDAAADDVAVAGYSVRVGTATEPVVASRSLFGPITSSEIRELGVGTYDVEVFAYDTSGNEGAGEG